MDKPEFILFEDSIIQLNSVSSVHRGKGLCPNIVISMTNKDDLEYDFSSDQARDTAFKNLCKRLIPLV